jgi:hypothetical protein
MVVFTPKKKLRNFMAGKEILRARLSVFSDHETALRATSGPLRVIAVLKMCFLWLTRGIRLVSPGWR